MGVPLGGRGRDSFAKFTAKTKGRELARTIHEASHDPGPHGAIERADTAVRSRAHSALAFRCPPLVLRGGSMHRFKLRYVLTMGVLLTIPAFACGVGPVVFQLIQRVQALEAESDA